MGVFAFAFFEVIDGCWRRGIGDRSSDNEELED
jgi:hypothetical protein